MKSASAGKSEYFASCTRPLSLICFAIFFLRFLAIFFFAGSELIFGNNYGKELLILKWLILFG
jgi:hypothetical protein